MNALHQNSIQRALLSVFGVVIFIAVWQIVTSLHLIPSFFLPSPAVIAKSIVYLFAQGTLLADIFASVGRIFGGFALSFVVAFPLGICFGISKKSESIIEPIVAFIRYVPPSAFVPLVIIWFGVGEWGKVVLIFLGVAPYLTLLIADAIKAVRKELVEAALTLGLTNREVVWRVLIPAAMPAIWDTCRLMIGAAWTFVIIAEIVGSSSGLGHLMIESQRFLRTDVIFAGVVVIGVLGIVTDYLFKISGKILFEWKEEYHA